VNNDTTIWADRLYTTEYIATYKNLASNVGKPRTQAREYHFAAVTNYDFSGSPLFSVGKALKCPTTKDLKDARSGAACP